MPHSNKHQPRNKRLPRAHTPSKSSSTPNLPSAPYPAPCKSYATGSERCCATVRYVFLFFYFPKPGDNIGLIDKKNGALPQKTASLEGLKPHAEIPPTNTHYLSPVCHAPYPRDTLRRVEIISPYQPTAAMLQGGQSLISSRV
ncbi:unnamed protein product [Ectocarpus sp. 8 AP-2014]